MILNTRPADRHDGLRDHFTYGVVPCPVLELRALPWGCDDIENFDALIITSQSIFRTTETITPNKDVPIYAVGRATADAARRAGFSSVKSAQGTAQSLLHLLDESRFESGVYLSASHVSTDLALARPGRITRKIVYEMTPSDRLPEDAVSAIASGRPFVVPLYSPRSVVAFERLIRDYRLEQCLCHATAVLIHPRLFSKMTLKWNEVLVAEKPANDSVITTIRAVP